MERQTFESLEFAGSPANPVGELRLIRRLLQRGASAAEIKAADDQLERAA